MALKSDVIARSIVEVVAQDNNMEKDTEKFVRDLQSWVDKHPITIDAQLSTDELKNSLKDYENYFKRLNDLKNKYIQKDKSRKSLASMETDLWNEWDKY